MTVEPFVPPPYPYERLEGMVKIADELAGGAVDWSIGTPIDPAPAAAVAALSSSGTERGYPPSIGTPELRDAIVSWIGRRFDVRVDADDVAACVGTKEFVGTLPQWLKLRTPDRDTILYPDIAYPTYEMGATLAGCRPVPVSTAADGGLDLASISQDDAKRALALWVNSPSNPTGSCDDLGATARWGRSHGVPVFSDECYVEFTWNGPGRSILEHGVDGVIAVHSLSKRSNLAGARVGFYAGDPELVSFLSDVRKHVGMMVPGPVQAAGVIALDDDEHVAHQRTTYLRRLQRASDILSRWSGRDVPLPDGGFYLWFDVDDGWEFTERLARDGGAVVSPGEFYGPKCSAFVRVAMVQPDERIELVARRLGVE